MFPGSISSGKIYVPKFPHGPMYLEEREHVSPYVSLTFLERMKNIQLRQDAMTFHSRERYKAEGKELTSHASGQVLHHPY